MKNMICDVCGSKEFQRPVSMNPLIDCNKDGRLWQTKIHQKLLTNKRNSIVSACAIFRDLVMRYADSNREDFENIHCKNCKGIVRFCEECGVSFVGKGKENMCDRCLKINNRRWTK